MCIFSCDLGGTFTKWGIFDGGKLVKNGEFESGANLGGRVLLERVIKQIPKIIGDLELDGIAISSAGTINSKSGLVVQASDIIPGYKGMNLIKTFQEHFCVPVSAENDVNCAVYAEAMAGVAKDVSLVYGLTIGTGVGSAIIMDKKIYHGSNHFAGEVGYLTINNEGLDLSGSARGLAIRVAQRKSDDPSLWNGKRVFEGYFNKDIICIEEIEKMADSISEVISYSICFLNPHMIVLGGGVIAQKDIILPLISERLLNKVPSNILEKTCIEAASFGNLAGIYGAYYHFKECYQEVSC